MVRKGHVDMKRGREAGDLWDTMTVKEDRAGLRAVPAEEASVGHQGLLQMNRRP